MKEERRDAELREEERLKVGGEVDRLRRTVNVREDERHGGERAEKMKHARAGNK